MNRRTLIASFLGMLPVAVLGLPVAVLGKTKKTDKKEMFTGCKRSAYGTFWYKNGKLHRVDGPAVEYTDGSKFWFQNDKLHRTDGPSTEYADGTKHWYQKGKLHRTGGPAVEWADGTREWYQNGKRVSLLEHS